MLAPVLAPILALGIPAVAGLLVFTWCKRTLGAPTGTIVVTDRRTMRSALRKVTAAQRAGDVHLAAVGLTALSAWLGEQIAGGPRRYRAGYAELKKQVDVTLAAARNALAVKVGR